MNRCATEWYVKAVEKGLMQAMMIMTFRYGMSNGVPQDHVKSLEYHLKVVEQGNMNARYEIASAYEIGRTVPKDEAKAMERFAKMAKPRQRRR
ncbi:hypothetical protein BGZ97_007915 [Linnemannia gamsii]|uniref:Sel1 repeat family protein n=1 Tax=Linnemannia gamsii TaxID=64522 RepID=A0A9P6R9V3_9FUNG|nr:hypothetical protein BGZ97_007915 [Linnemannia gamsii]